MKFVTEIRVMPGIDITMYNQEFESYQKLIQYGSSIIQLFDRHYECF